MKSFVFVFFAVFQFFLSAFAKPVCVNTDFFKKFDDEYLTKYIYQAIANNHQIKEANSRIDRFRYEIKRTFADEFPQLSANANYLGVHFPTGDNNIFIKRNSFILPFLVNWEVDLLLKNKDKIKSREAVYEAELANQKATYISLLSDVAGAYINILLYDYLIEKQKDILKNKNLNVDFENKKFQFGISDEYSLNKEKQSLKNEVDYFDNLIKNQKTMLYNFSTLIGESAVNFEEIKRGKIEDFDYTESIPEIICSDLIYSRPDVIEAENRLKSAKFDITAAKKDFFPRFNIMALMFFDTAGGGNFFNWNSSFAFLLAGAAQDLFNGGRKIANLKIKKARYKELFERYRQTDLTAIQEISNALNLIKQDKLLENNSKEKLILEKRNKNIAKSKLDKGIISKSDYIDYEINTNQKEQFFANAKAARLIDYITLYKALGGEL